MTGRPYPRQHVERVLTDAELQPVFRIASAGCPSNPLAVVRGVSRSCPDAGEFGALSAAPAFSAAPSASSG